MRLWRNNGLSIVVFSVFALLLSGQALTGLRMENNDRREHNEPAQTFSQYLRSAHFLEATAENWESEFLQMAAYVWLTAFLYQKGSSESKDPDKQSEACDREPDPSRPGAPWPVRRGGVALLLYRNSLVIALLLLFTASLVMHGIGGAGVYREELRAHGDGQSVTLLDYMSGSRFWFESLQNWQSEFLAVLTIVVLSIFLRQHGSPESKPVDAAHRDTGNS